VAPLEPELGKAGRFGFNGDPAVRSVPVLVRRPVGDQILVMQLEADADGGVDDFGCLAHRKASAAGLFRDSGQ